MDWGLQGWGCYEAAEFKEQQDLKHENIGKWEKSKKYLELKFGGGGAKKYLQTMYVQRRKKEFAKKLAEKSIQSRW